jgi:hypothetical protein
MMDDDHAIVRQANIELEPIHTQRDRKIEGCQRIFGCQPAAAAVREDKRPRRMEERVRHGRRV